MMLRVCATLFLLQLVFEAGQPSNRHPHKSSKLHANSPKSKQTSRNEPPWDSEKKVSMGFPPTRRCDRVRPQPPPQPDLNSMSMWDYIEQTENKIQIHNDGAVLILGNVKSGKTTVALATAGNMDDLHVFRNTSFQFVIVDPDRKIGNFQLPRTLVPELIADKENNLYVYDMPGFDKNRQLKDDVVTKYLMNPVTKSLPSVRIVLTIPERFISDDFPFFYDVGEEPIEETEFLDLTTAIVRTINDVDTLEKGIGLVVTHVEIYDVDGKFRKTDSVINEVRKYIQKFLEEEKEKLENLTKSARRHKKSSVPLERLIGKQHKRGRGVTPSSSEDDLNIIRERIKLAKILLQENKIAVFRIPGACGTLEESGWGTKSRDGMRKLMMETLKNVEISRNQLTHYVARDKIGNLTELYKQLNANTTGAMEMLVSRLNIGQTDATTLIQDFYASKAWIDADYGNFTTAVESVNTSTSPKDVGRSMYSTIFLRGYNEIWASLFEKEMRKNEIRMEIIDTVSPPGIEFDRLTNDWLNPMRVWLKDVVEERRVWYDFLSKLRPVFLTHSFQYKRKNITKPKNLLQIAAALEKVQRKSLVTEEVIRIYENGTHNSKEVKDLLWEMVGEAFEDHTIECIKRESPYTPKLVVRGRIVLYRDIIRPDLSFLLCNREPPSQVLVFATKKFILDWNSRAWGKKDWEVELGVVSPELDIPERKREIYLYGLRGSATYNFERMDPPTKSTVQYALLNSTKKPRKMISEAVVQYSLFNSTMRSYQKGKKSKWDVSYGDNEMDLMQVGKSDVPTYLNEYNPRAKEIMNSRPPWYVEELCRNYGKPSEGKRGTDGAPGQHGNPGGSFIGLFYNSSSDLSRLYINLEGGGGENGRDGGRGGEGAKGLNCPKKFERTQRNYTNGSTGPCFHDCKKIGSCDRKLQWYTNYFDDCNGVALWTVKCTTGGCMGGKGGQGGDGGALGQGGLSGRVIIVIANMTGKPNITSISGPNGQGGKGGPGNLGGQRGNGRTEFMVTSLHSDRSKCTGFVQTVSEYVPPISRESSGSSGRNGVNKKGQRERRRPNYAITAADLYLSYREYYFTKHSAHFPHHDFINFIDTSPQVVKTFTMNTFADEMLKLERLHIQLKTKGNKRDSVTLQMIPRYESLATRVDVYAKITKNLPNTSKKFLSLLYSLCLNQVRTLKQVMGTPMIVDFKGYLDALGRRIKQYNRIKDESDQRDMVEGERERYQQTFYDKIQESMRFISETVDPQVDNIQKAINEVTKEFIDAIEKLIEEAKATEKTLREAQKKAKRAMEVKKLSSPLTGIASIISACEVPFVGLIAEGINRVVNTGEEMLLGEEQEVRKPKELPKSVKKYANLWNEKKRSISPERISIVKELVEKSREAVVAAKKAIADAKVEHPSDISEIEKWGFAVLKGLEDGPIVTGVNLLAHLGSGSDFSSVDAYMEGQNNLSSFEDGAISKFEAFVKDKDRLDPKNLMKGAKAAFSMLSQANRLLGMGKDAYDKINESKNKHQQIVGYVQEADGNTKDLQTFKMSVSEVLVPFASSVITEMKDAKANMENATQASLRIQKFEILKSLRKLNSFLQDISQSFTDVATDFSLLLKNLEDSMVLAIDLHGYIDQYKEQMRFADYIANLHTKKAKETNLGKLAPTYQKINLALLGSMILSEWDAAVQNFEQWVFPFSDLYRKTFQKTIPDYLTQNITDTSALLDRLIPEVETWVGELTTEILSYKSSIIPAIDNQLINTTFNSEFTTSFPFHVWEAEQHANEIKDLLSGLAVSLSITPDYTYTRQMSAVKFFIAEINVKARNQSHQKELDTILKFVRVEMQHGGTSRYLFNGESFSMVGQKQLIKFHFEKDETGQRLGRNRVYIKLQEGEIIMSPYTTWNIWLRKTPGHSEFDFGRLAKFIGSVDIELVGKGTYVSEEDNPSSDPRAKLLHAAARSLRGNRKRRRNPEPIFYTRFKTSGSGVYAGGSVLNGI